MINNLALLFSIASVFYIVIIAGIRTRSDWQRK